MFHSPYNNFSSEHRKTVADNNSETLWNASLSLSAAATGQLINMDSSSARFYGLFFVPLPILTVLGNVLVLLAVIQEPGLRTPTNYLLVSLAAADLFVGVVVEPLSIYAFANNFCPSKLSVACSFYRFVDVAACSASILNLVAISIERFLAVVRAHSYRTANSRWRVIPTIAGTWIISVSSATFIGSLTAEDDEYYLLLYGSIVRFYVPTVVMIVTYGVIWKRLNRRLRVAQLQEMAAANVATFGSNLHKIIAGAYECSHTGPLSWAMPFFEHIEDQRSDSDISISLEDLQELTTLFYTLEASRPPRLQRQNAACFSDASCILEQGSYAMMDPGSVSGIADTGSYGIVDCGSDTIDPEHETLFYSLAAEHPRPPCGPLDVLSSMEEIPNGSESVVDSCYYTHERNTARSFDHEHRNGNRNGNVGSLELLDDERSISETTPFKDARTNAAAKLRRERWQAMATKNRRRTILNNQRRRFSCPVNVRRRFDSVPCVVPHQVVKPASKQVGKQVSKHTEKQVSKPGRPRTDSQAQLALARAINAKDKMIALLMRLMSKEGQGMRKESRATKLVLTVLAVFLLCWLPYFSGCIAKAALLSDSSWTAEMELSLNLLHWLGYLNSCLNPVVYTLVNRRFRKAIRAVLRLKTENRCKTKAAYIQELSKYVEMAQGRRIYKGDDMREEHPQLAN